jgi:hypothetical protein
VWDSVTQHLNNSEFDASLNDFVDKWMDKLFRMDVGVELKSDILLAVKLKGNDESLQPVVMAGGTAFRYFHNGEIQGDWFPTHLRQCLLGGFPQ